MSKRKSLGRFVITLTLCGVILATPLMPPAMALTWYDTNAPFVQQEKSMWCWAACSVSMLTTVGYHYTQWEHAMLIGQANMNNGRYLWDCATDFKLFYNKNLYCPSSSTSDPRKTMTSSDILSRITAGKPIMCHMVWNNGNGHIVLITACTQQTTYGVDLEIMDPAKSTWVYYSRDDFTDWYNYNSSSGTGGYWYTYAYIN